VPDYLPELEAPAPQRDPGAIDEQTGENAGDVPGALIARGFVMTDMLLGREGDVDSIMMVRRQAPR